MPPLPDAAVLDRLRQLLAKADLLPKSGGSMVQGRFPATALALRVADLGALSVPPSAVQLAALQSRSRPAPDGCDKAEDARDARWRAALVVARDRLLGVGP